MSTTVGLENYRHETGTCHTTFVLPGCTSPQACGDPRCEAVARDRAYRVEVSFGRRRHELVSLAFDHEAARDHGLREFAVQYPPELAGFTATVKVFDAVTDDLLLWHSLPVPSRRP